MKPSVGFLSKRSLLSYRTTKRARHPGILCWRGPLPVNCVSKQPQVLASSPFLQATETETAGCLASALLFQVALKAEGDIFTTSS